MTATTGTAGAAGTKLDEYRAQVLASEAAADAATTERDRAFHRRASSIFRQLIRNVDQAASRVVEPAPVKPAKKAVPAVSLKRP